MIVKRIVKNEDGNLDVTLMLTQEQAKFFMNMGLSVLVQKGAVTLMDYTEEEFIKEQQAEQQEQAPVVSLDAPQPASTVQNEQQKAFLEGVDIELLHKA